MSESGVSDELLERYPQALGKAVKLLALRARSVHEIQDRLKRQGFGDETVEMVICKLEKEGLADDGEFARKWAEYRARNGYGKARIAGELRQKGVSGEFIDAALEGLDPWESDGATTALARKMLKRYDGIGPQEAVKKAYACMIRRGYSYSEAQSALNSAVKEER